MILESCLWGSSTSCYLRTLHIVACHLIGIHLPRYLNSYSFQKKIKTLQLKLMFFLKKNYEESTHRLELARGWVMPTKQSKHNDHNQRGGVQYLSYCVQDVLCASIVMNTEIIEVITETRNIRHSIIPSPP